MTSNSLTYTVLFTLVLYITVQNVLGQSSPQYIHFYNSTDCSGTAFPVNSTQSFVIPVNMSIGSARFNGMWKYQVCPGNLTICNKPKLLYQVNGNACEFWTPTKRNINVTRYGDANQNDPLSLHLHRDIDFGGFENIVINNRSANLNIRISSWYFTGSSTSSWMIYEGTNFNGSSKCLSPTTDVKKNGYGFTYSRNQVFTVKSVSRGNCTSSGNGLKSQTTPLITLLSVFMVAFVAFK